MKSNTPTKTPKSSKQSEELARNQPVKPRRYALPPRIKGNQQTRGADYRAKHCSGAALNQKPIQPECPIKDGSW